MAITALDVNTYVVIASLVLVTRVQGSVLRDALKAGKGQLVIQVCDTSLKIICLSHVYPTNQQTTTA